MKIAYDISTGFVDFPGKFSATIFFTGCNLTCDYCYNKNVIYGEPTISLDEITSYLKRLSKNFSYDKNDKLGVVLSGGEPTINNNFTLVVNELKNDYCLGLHTNGLVLPKENVFKCVILSLKHPNDGLKFGLEKYDEYLNLVKKAIVFYNDSQLYKEMRFVDIQDQESWMEDLCLDINNFREANSWKIKKVKNLKEK